MARMIIIKGMQKVLRNIDKAKNRLGQGVERGLIRGGLHIQRESMKIVPVQEGNLRGGAFTRNIGGKGFRVDVIVGYVAKYAVFVHENLQARHGASFNAYYAKQIATARPNHPVWFKRGKNQQAKFLEKPARESRREVLRIIKTESRLI